MAKKVPVTSVTPKVRTTATSKQQAARTRDLASWVIPYGKVGRVAGAIKKVATNKKVIGAAGAAAMAVGLKGDTKKKAK